MLNVVSQPKLIPRLVLCLAIVITCALGLITWYNPQALYPDPAWGFQIIRSMERGSGFNQLVTPSHADIARNSSAYITWWSPGQYLFPYVFKSVLHLSYGQAATLTIVLAELLGIFGFYYCFKQAGFSRIVAALSILLMVSQQFYYIPFVFYNGGEVLLFAFGGWFFYGCLRISHTGWQCLLFVLLSGWIGFLCKSAFIWVYAAGICSLWLRLCLYEQQPKQWVKNALLTGLPAAISLLAVYRFFLSKGHNPAASHKGLRLLWETCLFPLASPLLSGLSLDDLLGGLIYHTEEPLFSYTVSIILLALFAAASLFLVWLVLRSKTISKSYQILVVVTFAFAVLFFGSAFLMQSAISYEGRHFRMLGLLLVPVILSQVLNSKSWFIAVCEFFWMIIAVYSLLFLIKGKANNKHESAHGLAGISQQYTDNYSLKYLSNLDRPDGRAIFVITEPDIALEIQHGRVITLKPVGPDIALNYADFIYKGHAGPLYIYLPVDYSPAGRAMLLNRCFPGYANFRHTLVTLDHEVYWSE